ncbi:hypothetical protein OOT00_15185 [Desulfobotulus sp. H1]|uniref:Uncharacterized protein n=1 Tax=Desulfobotulus pelophilus TaxID=2823377 RepID=A0ABT3NDR4_9BACT|nr:DUF6678 family protein [Desulfobotulus pelophilus]MCW7755326.1 hypothetical protein [Desulfobotulus pelophilus]
MIKIIDKRQLVSVMNKTKWRELCEDFEKIQDLYVNVRYKLISSDQVYDFGPVWWNLVFDEAATIEWMDFNPIKKEHAGRFIPDKETDISEIILNIFKKHTIPYSIEQKYYRVWGYVGKNEHPTFV